MAQLTHEYLESLGFHQSWGRDHGYRTQYSRYDDLVTRGIELISQTDAVLAAQGTPDERFDVWFYGQDLYQRYTEFDSHMTISTVEELDMVLSLLRNREETDVHFYPKDRFDSYEEFVAYMKKEGLAIDAPE